MHVPLYFPSNKLEIVKKIMYTKLQTTIKLNKNKLN